MTARHTRRILIICFGNICRSPFAARFLAQALPVNLFEVDSAGFFGPGRRSPEQARGVAATYGVDLDGHRSKVITTELLRKQDLIIAMDAAQRRRLLREHRVPGRLVLILGDLDPDAIDSRTILDPYGGTADEFAHCYVRIQRCARTLAVCLEQAYDRGSRTPEAPCDAV